MSEGFLLRRLCEFIGVATFGSERVGERCGARMTTKNRSDGRAEKGEKAAASSTADFRGGHVAPESGESGGPDIVFAARSLSKTYVLGEVRVQALHDVNLDIRAGEFIVLLGPSGSGKSTLLNILGGLDAPTSGAARWRDHNLVGANESELTRYRREHVGFIFQFYNLIPSLTALENVALVNEIAEKPLDPMEVLTMVGLAGKADRFPSQLSGGEQQRVAVARAIVKSPDVLLCDEPTGALDVDTGRVVLGAIARVNERFGTTTLVVSHNSAIAGMADRVLHMGGGRIVSEERNARRLSADEVGW